VNHGYPCSPPQTTFLPPTFKCLRHLLKAFLNSLKKLRKGETLGRFEVGIGFVSRWIGRSRTQLRQRPTFCQLLSSLPSTCPTLVSAFGRPATAGTPSPRARLRSRSSWRTPPPRPSTCPPWIGRDEARWVGREGRGSYLQGRWGLGESF
jgi:hypothetical protein